MEKSLPFVHGKGGKVQGVAQIFIGLALLLGTDPVSLFEDELFIGIAAPDLLNHLAASWLFQDLELKELFRAQFQELPVWDKELEEQLAILFENRFDLLEALSYPFPAYKEIEGVIGDDHGVELPGEGQRGHIHAQIGDVWHGLELGQTQHRERQVNAGDMSPGRGQLPAETAAAAAKLEDGAGDLDPFLVKGEISMKLGHFHVVKLTVAFMAQGQKELIRLLVAVKYICCHLAMGQSVLVDEKKVRGAAAVLA